MMRDVGGLGNPSRLPRAAPLNAGHHTAMATNVAVVSLGTSQGRKRPRETQKRSSQRGGRQVVLLRTVPNQIRGERRFYPSASLCRSEGASACPTGRATRQNGIESRSRASPRPCRLYFHLLCSHV